MKKLAPNPAPSSDSLTIVQPSDKAINMTTEELCQWLKNKKITPEYIKFFEGNDIDGSVLATFDDQDLKDLGISEPYIRKKIRTQFRRIS